MRLNSDRYVGAVMTVRNEHDLLRNNILFHRFIGIDRFYIYLDAPSDTSAETISDLDYVVINHSRLPAWLTPEEIPDARRLSGRFLTHHTARQLINCHDAIRRAREDGLAWLISIDPDELILLDDQSVRRRSLADYLSQLSRSVETVTFPTNEVLSTSITYQNVFEEEVLFKRRYGYGEGLRPNSLQSPCHPEWAVRSVDGIEYVRKAMDVDKALRESSFQFTETDFVDVPHIILADCPSEGPILVADWFIGHVIGKQAFRICREIDFRSLHTARLSSHGLNEVCGRLLHYNCYSFEKFLSKFRSFRAHPNSYTKGSPVDDLKLALRDIVNFRRSSTRQHLHELFESKFCFQGRRLSALSSLWPESIIAIPSVAELFQSTLSPVRKRAVRLPRRGIASAEEEM
jgi:hypothetical protein